MYKVVYIGFFYFIGLAVDDFAIFDKQNGGEAAHTATTNGSSFNLIWLVSQYIWLIVQHLWLCRPRLGR